MIVGIRRNLQFGLAMTLGSGGILVELLKDAETVLLPGGTPEIHRVLERLKLGSLLNGFRGRPAVDLNGLAARLAELGDFALAHADSLAEIGINPLFVYEKDVIAVAPLIHVAGSGPQC